MFPMPQNPSIVSSCTTSDKSVSIVPPNIIVKAGQSSVTAYAQFHAKYISHSRNTQFVQAVPDFLNTLDQSSSLRLSDIISDNVSHHLKALEADGLLLGDVLSRLCAIDLFMTQMAKVEGLRRLSPLVHTELGYPVPPRLLVESTTATSDFVGVYGDFLARHTNQRTRESYYVSLRRFFNYCSGTQIQDIRYIRGGTMAGFIEHCSHKDDTGLVDDKARTVSATMSAVRTLFDLYIVEA